MKQGSKLQNVILFGDLLNVWFHRNKLHTRGEFYNIRKRNSSEFDLKSIIRKCRHSMVQGALIILLSTPSVFLYQLILEYWFHLRSKKKKL